MSGSRRPRIGDVYEIPTPRGLAYVQYTHENDLMGSLIRVLPGIHQELPMDLVDIVAGPTRFEAFYPIRAASRDPELAHFVANLPVPMPAQRFPVMKWVVGPDERGRPLGWSLWDGRDIIRKNMPVLLPEHRDLPEVSAFNHAYLVDRLVTDWSWATQADEWEAAS